MRTGSTRVSRTVSWLVDKAKWTNDSKRPSTPWPASPGVRMRGDSNEYRTVQPAPQPTGRLARRARPRHVDPRRTRRCLGGRHCDTDADGTGLVDSQRGHSLAGHPGGQKSMAVLPGRGRVRLGRDLLTSDPGHRDSQLSGRGNAGHEAPVGTAL